MARERLTGTKEPSETRRDEARLETDSGGGRLEKFVLTTRDYKEDVRHSHSRGHHHLRHSRHFHAHLASEHGTCSRCAQIVARLCPAPAVRTLHHAASRSAFVVAAHC